MNGAGALALRVRRLVLVVLFAACADRPDDRQARLRLGRDTVLLAPGARIIDIHVRAEPGGAEFEPARVAARTGDVLRFGARDGGPHAIVFDNGLTGAAALAFLEATGQARGLPLLESGAEWVVSLAGAPAGRYVARCLTHAGVALIELTPTGR